MPRIEFPKGGLNDDTSRADQPPLTTAEALNVRTIDPSTGRSRGGQRAGTSQFLTGALNGSQPVQALEQTMRPVSHLSVTSLGSTSVTASNAATGTVSIVDYSLVDIHTLAGGGFAVGDRITISDGTTSLTFELTFNEDFTSNPDFVGFTYAGSSAALTVLNLALKINEQAGYDIGAAIDLNDPLTINLINMNPDSGAAGNVTITVLQDNGTAWAVTGMSGGVTADTNTLQVEWSKEPQQASAVLYTLSDANSNVWAVTDAGTAVQYNQDGRPVVTIQPPIPSGHTIVPRLAVGSDDSVFLASYKVDGEDESRIWRFVRGEDEYTQKWEITVDGRVRELRENVGAMYVVTDLRTTDDQDVGGMFTGYAGLTQSTPFAFFQAECPMPTFAMDIAPNGTIAMAHPFENGRGKSTNSATLTARAAAPDLWTPWDLDAYRERLFAWYRAEDALDGSGEPCGDGDEVATLPDHRQNPPSGYSAVYDTTDRILAKNERNGPVFKASGPAGLMPSLDFDPSRYTAGSLDGEMLRDGGIPGGTAKTATDDTLAQTSPIPSWDDSYYAIVFAIRFNGTAATQRVLWSQHDPASGISGSSYGFVTGSGGGNVGLGGMTSLDRAVWLDAGSDAGSPGTVLSGDHPTAGASFLNYNEDAAQGISKRVAIVSIVKGNLAGDGLATSVIRVNGKQVDCFEFEYDKCDGDRFILGCRRQADAQGTGDLYTDTFGIFESWRGQFLEWVTVLGASTADNSPHDIPVTCPLAGEGAGGNSDDGYEVSGSVPSHIAHLDPANATEVERIEGYLAHKYGASSGLPLLYSAGVPRSDTGYYEAHPFGGPGFHPLGPDRVNDKAYWLNAWVSSTTLWSAGGNLIDAMVGSGSGVGVTFDEDGRCITGGSLQFRYTDTLDNEKDNHFRKALVVSGRFKQPRCARATITLTGIPPNAEAITLTDNLVTVTFEFTTVAASGSNVKVDTSVTPTDYSSGARLVLINFLEALEASALNTEGWFADSPIGATQTVELIQGVVGTAKETAIIITSAGTITGDSAFDDAQDATGSWRARASDSLKALSVSNGDGVVLRTDTDGNFYHADRTYLSDNGIVRRKATDGSVQWRYLFAGDEIAMAVAVPPNPPDYAGASVDGPEFIYAGIATGALGGESLYKLRILDVAEDLSGNRSPREAVYIGVCGGSIVTFTASGSATIPTGGSDLFTTTTPYIQTAVLRNQVFFTDGLMAYVYDAEEDEVTPFESETVSSYPRRFRLIASWRNRLVVARVPGDDTNWWMSRSGDAFDWDENPSIVDAQQPVSGNTSKGRVGRSPDVINSLIPWSDDLLIIGGDRSIWRMTGDPMQGAQVDLVSDSTGIAYLSPWCKDPDGTLYFFGSRGGVWVMPPGGMPQRITKHSIERRMQALDLSQYKIQMVWNYYDEGLHVFAIPYNLTEISEPVAWFYDAKHGAWWEDQWQDTSTAVRSVLLADGDRPDDRRVLLGCKDGKVRFIDPDSTTDDGLRIDSHVLIGPLLPESAEHEARFTGLTAVLGDTLGPLAYEVLIGEDSENAEVVGRGNWTPGRNPISRERWAGPAAWVRLRSGGADAWAMESMHVQVYPTSRKRIK